MNLKKILSVFLTFVMIVGMTSMVICTATDCTVADNIIDITDKEVYSFARYYAKAINIKIDGADVVKATEEGTTIDIVLDGTTNQSAEIFIEFGTSLNKCTMSGHNAAVALDNGIASIDMTLKGQYSTMSSMSATATYSLNFSLDEVPTTVPTRIVETDSKSTYSGVVLDLNLKEYFEGAKKYYIVDGNEKKLVDGTTYAFKSFTDGIHTLIFSASNDIGECLEFVKVTIDVTEIASGAWIGISTDKGSVNYVRFTDADGNEIDGLTAYLEGENIAVNLPRTFEPNAAITATFDLTQNDGLPKLSTSNAFNGSNNTKVFTNTLSKGMAKRTMYLYHANPKATSNVYTTYTISYAIENEIPVLAEGYEKTASSEIIAGESYTLDLAPIFNDDDGDELVYSVKINGEAAIFADANYSFTPELGGTYELEFFAGDFMAYSEESYKVILTVTNSAETYNMSVLLPEDITPAFYITSGYDENNTDIVGDVIESEKGEIIDGYCSYTVSVPENVSLISVRDESYGGMSIPASRESAIKLCKIQTEIIDFSDEIISGSFAVSYGEYKAAGINGKFLLMPDVEYSFTASPENTSVYSTKTEIHNISDATHKVTVKVPYKNPKTVITTTGAKAKLFKYSNNYFVHTVYEPLATVDNGNGTSTHYFAAEGDLSYRVSMEDKITKAGYIKVGNSVTVLHSEDDKLPTDRSDYFTETTDAATVGDDSVLLNINQKNHLSLEVGESKTIKAYRTWQIIDLTYNNHIIEPDFHFNILSGEDVISLETIADQPTTNGSGNWKTITAIGEGTAIVEVTYDAIEIKGSSFDGLYGANDPARCGLFVVTVGENVPDVDFGIESKSSLGSMVYNEANAKPWDSEFDTLYFIGESGEIKLSPSFAQGTITEVAVSGNKGENYTVLAQTDGVYTAPITPGNNIIRITTDMGIAYKTVRGDKVELKVKNNTHPGKPINAGDEICLTLAGVHIPIAKIAGTYNPGYKSNTDGDGGVHLHYNFGDVTIKSEGKQYNFSKEGTTVKFTMPENSEETQFTLTDGYIGFGIIGVTAFPDDGESHRNIPDSGGTTRGNKTSFHTRSILPDITVSLGMLPSDNTAPYIRENAPKTETLNLGGTYALSMSKVFADRDNDTLTYTVKVDDGEIAQIEDGYYVFTPDNVGTYAITFFAKDDETESGAHTITLTVKEKASTGSGTPDDEWDISDDEIEGYVNISFTDNGKRVQGESNVTYPKALGTIISSVKVPYTKGDTIADVTLRLLDAKNFTYQHTGTTKNAFYLASIGDFTLKGISYDSFGEFDAGAGSGWMITFNKKYIEYGASDFEVKNGDIIKWQYTCQLGADIGDRYTPTSSGSSTISTSKKDDKDIEDAKEDNDKNKKIFTNSIFNDISESSWYYDSVRYVYENDLMQGYGEKFQPENKMTRAMLVTVLYRIAGEPKEKTSHKFTDVLDEMWYSEAVKWAVSNGITNGTSTDKFAPDENISREQIAVILYRYVNLAGFDILADDELSCFTDSEKISPWALEAMKWAYSAGIIKGTGVASLSPESHATRAQIATILVRFNELINNKK